jgi:hypothetical protein
MAHRYCSRLGARWLLLREDRTYRGRRRIGVFHPERTSADMRICPKGDISQLGQGMTEKMFISRSRNYLNVP